MESQEYHTLRAVEDTHWWFRSLNELVVETLRRAVPGRDLRLLDAGCGTGGLAARLAALGQVDGIDASPIAVELCRERGLERVRRADLDTVSLPPEHYDAISCIDVLYHRGVVDEAAVLARLAAALRPGGVLFLHLPAFEWLRSRHDELVHTRRRYRLADAEGLVERAGLRVEHASYRVTLYFPAIVKLRLLAAIGRRLRRSDGSAPAPSDVRRVPAALNALLLAGARLENRLVRRRRLPFGVSLFVVARKPGAAAVH